MNLDAFRRALEDFSAASRPLAKTLAEGLAPAVRRGVEISPPMWQVVGFEAGRQGLPRDWSQPDDWHRGYLRGRLVRARRGRLEPPP
jgi:hypothetical protein